MHDVLRVSLNGAIGKCRKAELLAGLAHESLKGRDTEYADALRRLRDAHGEAARVYQAALDAAEVE
jgi:hypothetical protein